MDRVKDAMVAGNRKGVEMAAEHMGVAACRGEESHEGHGGQRRSQRSLGIKMRWRLVSFGSEQPLISFVTSSSPPPDMSTRSPSTCFPFVDRMI
jgi:hypothetical protein